MIDIENEVFNRVAEKLHSQYPSIFITGEYVKTPSSFPCVSLVEVDNTVDSSTSDTGSLENHAKLMYELNVYSNKDRGKKSECKKIAKSVDDILLGLGFARTMMQPIPNLGDSSIYRIVGRYTASVSKEKVIYRR